MSSGRPQLLNPVFRRNPWLGLIAFVVFAAIFGSVLTVVCIGAVRHGLSIQRLRDAPGAHVETLFVTSVVAHDDSKETPWESIGYYVDSIPKSRVENVAVVPHFAQPARGPLQVLVSDAHPHLAVRADYTATGYLSAGIGGLAAVWLTILICLSALFSRGRRGQPQLVLPDGASLDGAKITLWIRGIVRGPGIPAVVGECELGIGDSGVVAYEQAVGREAWWHVPLQRVTSISPNYSGSLDIPHPVTWRTMDVVTVEGTFTITSSAFFLADVRAAVRKLGAVPD